MNTDQTTPTSHSQRPYRIVDLNYMSLYIKDFQEAIAFYTQVFGAPESIAENKVIYGWRMGSTWLTVFPSKVGSQPNSNPRNAEFAVQVSTVDEVDLLHHALIEAGAITFMPPQDTTMYEPMRYCCVDDPFGVRIDVYCPLGSHSS
jgi:uncharacterized glyoxalase superfamily protein PhnB